MNERGVDSLGVLMSFRGKGDYHRLGHGTDDHVRRPRKVSSLQGKKIISIATGDHLFLTNYKSPLLILHFDVR